ncbi:signal peptidase I [bacterium]|nr:signal peptidase I [bacterium]
MEKIRELMPYIIILIIVILLKCFVVTPIRVNGTSMIPTLHPKDIMILNKTAYYTKNPKRFDIVVVDLEDEKIIKRVIGLPGEEVEYHNNTLYINGKKVKENIDKVDTDDYKSGKIPKDSYLVLGDNRKGSYDGRMFGFIKKKQIEGKTSLTILPFKRIGFRK